MHKGNIELINNNGKESNYFALNSEWKNKKIKEREREIDYLGKMEIEEVHVL